MDTKSTLGLDLPARTAAAKSAFLTNPKEVDIWISNLPSANLGETSRQVFNALVEFNRREIPNNTRLKVAELFQQPIEYITANLRKYFFDAPFPLSAKNRKIAALSRELNTEHAISYKIIVESIFSGRSGRFDSKMMVIAILRSMHALLAVIYHALLVYDTYPKGIWQEIHRLYAYSEHNKIHKTLVKNGRKKGADSSIYNIYKQLLLLASTSPLSYRQSDIQQIFNELPMWSQRITLTHPDHTPGDATGLFISQLSSDLPPVHLELKKKELNGPYLLLHTRELVRHLQEHFEANKDTQEGYSRSGIRPISKELLRQLIHEFSTVPHRKFSRTRLNFELHVAAGLSAVHTLLNPPTESNKAKPQKPSGTSGYMNDLIGSESANSSRFAFSEQNLTLVDHDDPIEAGGIYPGQVPSTKTKDPQTHGFTAPAPVSRVETYACRTINESAGGFCIDWKATGAPKIKIGELLGIRSASEETQYSIGIVRWMKRSGGENLHIGVEILSPSSSAVVTRLTDEADGSEQTHKGLLLPALTTSGQPESLIVPALPFNLGDTIWMEEESVKQQIRLTRLLESTGAFAQYQFVPLTRDSEQSDSLNEADTDFDSIWSTL